MRARITLAAAACAAVLVAGIAFAQPAFPDRPIKVVVTFAPGSTSDTVARRLGEHVARTLGQPVVVDTRLGAQGAIGARAVARSPADGYTLLVGGNSTHGSNPYLMKEPGYDPIKDFTAVTQWTTNPLLLVVNAEVPVRTVPEFLAYAKERPGKLNYGTGNTGGLVAFQMLKSQTGIDAVGVNYPGTAQAATDMVGGRLQFMITDPGVVSAFVQAGKLRILGITTRQRLPTLPEAAPLADSGLPGYEYASWIGLFAPAGVPADVARRLQQAYAKALSDPEIERYLIGMGMIPVGSTPEQFGTYVQAQVRLWGRLIKEAGLTPQ